MSWQSLKRDLGRLLIPLQRRFDVENSYGTFPNLGHVRSIGLPLTPREVRYRVRGPRIALHGFPKGGTNLLLTLVRQLPGVVSRWTYSTTASWLPSTDWLLIPRRGQCFCTHFFWDAEIAACLKLHEVKSLFVFRDLRDVLVSRMFYMRDRVSGHSVSEVLRQKSDPESQLLLCLEGSSDPKLAFAPLVEWARGYYPWVQDSECATVRFEDLIGPKGGGSEERQLAALDTVCRHLDIRLDATQRAALAKRIFNQDSTTFREGQIGGWRRHFTPLVEARFKELLGADLIRYGYEKDLTWSAQAPAGGKGS